MCKALEEMRNEAAARAELEKARQIALNLIALWEDSFEKIAKVTNLSIEEVRELAESKSAWHFTAVDNIWPEYMLLICRVKSIIIMKLSDYDYEGDYCAE